VLCTNHVLSIPARARGSQTDSLMMVPAPIELPGHPTTAPVESNTDTALH